MLFNTMEIYPSFKDNALFTETGNGRKRRKSVKWTLEEQEFVLNGYCRFGPLWTEMLKEYPFSPNRIHYDLRDKWENIKRHSNDPSCKRIFEYINKKGEHRNQSFLIKVEDNNAGEESGLINNHEKESKGKYEKSLKMKAIDLINEQFIKMGDNGESNTENAFAAMYFS